ncbi:hypothetical protein ACUIG4_13980 [Raoultella ornithinolytica]|uniref:hypothetical protein n=1 Tax=Raoultella ornithinolytica TaxID=54291 RepID=UPI00403D73EA
MKTIREVELEIELAKARQQIVHLSILKMRGDMAALEQEISTLNNELEEMKQELTEEK